MAAPDSAVNLPLPVRDYDSVEFAFDKRMANNWQASATYVTGTHSIKVGFQDSWGPFNRASYANGDLYQNYTQVNGVETPQTVTVFATPAR